MAYTVNQTTGIHSLEFCCAWQSEDFFDGFITYNTEIGQFRLSLKRNFGRMDFLIRADGSNSSWLTVFNSCTARMPDKEYLYFGAVKFLNSTRPQFSTFF